MNKTKHIINELLVEVFNHILNIEEENLKKLGVNLSINEVHTLEAIENCSEPTMSNIAKKLRITTGTLTTSINRLVSKQYVVRETDKVDRRRVFVRLTDKANQILKLHKNFHDEMIDAIFKDIPIEEDEVLVKSLENIANYFKHKY